MPKGDSSEEDNDSQSSDLDGKDAQWDDMEQRALKALDEKLEALYPAGGNPSTTVSSPSAPAEDGKLSACASSAPAHSYESLSGILNSAAPGQSQRLACLSDDVGKALAEACAKDPYKPEEHVLTAEEMWGGLSSSDGEEPSAKKAESMRLSADQHEKDDTLLTAEEMWGGMPSDDDQEGTEAACMEQTEEQTSKHRAFAAAFASACAPQGERISVGHVGGVGAEASPKRTSAPSAQGARTDVVESSGVGAEERLRRILAGDAASSELSSLTFEELSRVADDCQRAVETLRWTLRRQRELTACTL